LSGGRGKKGEAREEAEVGAADWIDGANAGRVAEERFEDEAQGEALLGEARRLGWP